MSDYHSIASHRASVSLLDEETEQLCKLVGLEFHVTKMSFTDDEFWQVMHTKTGYCHQIAVKQPNMGNRSRAVRHAIQEVMKGIAHMDKNPG